jgi:hypothetical protein
MRPSRCPGPNLVAALAAAATLGIVAALVPSLSLTEGFAADLTAEQIIQKSSEKRNVRNSVQTMILKTFDKSGRFRERTIESKLKEGEDGRVRSYVRFLEPDDVAGVQFLTIQNPGGEDDQWLYMPAGEGLLNRISGSNRRASFMGTDFRFEDLEVGSADEGTHTLLGEEEVTVAGTTYPAYKIETIPNPEMKSSYTKLVTWVSTADFVPRQVEFYDKKGELEKRLTLREVKAVGDVMIPTLTVMENLKRGTRTEIVVSEYRINVDPAELPDEMFTPAFMQGEG